MRSRNKQTGRYQPKPAPAGLIHCKRFIPQPNLKYRTHEIACRFLMEHKDWTLCHGHLTYYDKKGRLMKKPFAWCENGSKFFDPRGKGIILAKGLQLGVRRLSLVKAFNYREARRMMSKHHRYSRWNESWRWGFWQYV